VTVADDGPGIAEADRERVFGAFEQAEPSANPGNGLGLGLTVSRVLVEAMGGQIWYEPGFPTGARFCFTLPAAPATSACPPPPEAGPGPRAAHHRACPARPRRLADGGSKGRPDTTACGPGSLCAIPSGGSMGSVVCSAVRTPLGRYGAPSAPCLRCSSAGWPSPPPRAGRPAADRVDEVYFGHVLQAGAGQITSRQAAYRGGIPMTVPATTINKVCLSGMSAIAMADRDIRLARPASWWPGHGIDEQRPIRRAQRALGARMGEVPMIDLMEHDGLFCAFDNCLMGATSDRRNAELGITRAEQDEWSAASHQRRPPPPGRGPSTPRSPPSRCRSARATPSCSPRRGHRSDSTAEALASCGPPSPRKARSPPATPPRSPTGRPPWCGRPGGGRRRRLPVIAEILATDRRPDRTPPCTSVPPRRCRSPSTGPDWP